MITQQRVDHGQIEVRGSFAPDFEKLPGELAEAIAEEARNRAPVRTGRLKRSISAVDGVVYIDAFYASFLEDGTSRSAPQPFVRPAIEAVRARDGENQ